MKTSTDPTPTTVAEGSDSGGLSGRNRLGLLINPLSGGNRSGMGRIKKTLAEYPEISHCEVQTPSDVASALTEFASKEINVVAVIGGDGTVQAVLTALFHLKLFPKLPLLAILRSGTDSMISRDVGLKGNPHRAMQRLLHWDCTGNGNASIARRSILRIDMGTRKSPIYGMFFGAASIYQGIQFCRGSMHTLGLHGDLANGLTLFRLLTMSLRKSGKLVPVPISVGLDENPPHQQEYLLMLISTLERLSMGLRPYWGTENGPLHYTAVGANPRYLLQSLPSLVRGRKNRYGSRENGYFSHNAHEIRLSIDSGFTIDGELFMPDKRLGSIVVQAGGEASFLQL